ncbi:MULTISPECIES: SGNH/GDSL hydrolase family protein [Streptomyces]|uniref:SGNH hydrolase-type esterase domain-containing protein n=1 Tax=Streptomyces mordarskii TaxID=1226758 RepID=A0ABN1DVZ7_9ACTN
MSRELDTSSGELDRTCPECQTGSRVDSLTSRRKYCSPSHHNHQPEAPVLLGRVSHRRPRGPDGDRTCPVCENSFEARRTVRTRYCSAVCRREAEHRRDRALDEERARRLGQAPPALPARIELPPPPPVRTASRQPAAVRDPLEPTATRNCPDAESDYYDKAEPKSKNSCHRSKIAWSRQATLPGSSKSIGALADSRDANMDYHFIACSGARTFNILNTGRSGELAQLKQGYLDQNTSLVTLSVGGNDARFTDIVKKCVLPTIWNCQAESLDNIDPDNGEKTGGDTGGLDEWAPKWLHEQIRPRITATLKTIHDKAPNAEIVLMGYPRLLEDNGSCVLGMEDVEGKWVNSVADILADEMKGAVDDANSQYKAKAVLSDPRGVFTGKAVCGDPESVHGIVISGQAQADNDLPKPSMQFVPPQARGCAPVCRLP